MNKNKLIDYAIKRVDMRNDLSEDQKQDLLVECLEYINNEKIIHTQQGVYHISLKAIKKEKFQYEYLEDLNISYTFDIGINKQLIEYFMNELRGYYYRGQRFIRIIEGVYFEGLTLKELSEELDISPTRVASVRNEALRKGRRIFIYSNILEGTEYEDMMIKPDLEKIERRKIAEKVKEQIKEEARQRKDLLRKQRELIRDKSEN